MEYNGTTFNSYTDPECLNTLRHGWTDGQTDRRQYKQGNHAIAKIYECPENCTPM